MSTELETLRWQFDLTWRLAQVQLPHLTDEMCIWAPARGAWSVRQSEDGVWRPDWNDVEPDPAPAVTIAWQAWHLIWWWSSIAAVMRGETPTRREDVVWPGKADAVVRRLDALGAEWSALLAALQDEDLTRPIAYPWPEARPLRLALAWVNAELMKNIAEIGSVRHLYEANPRS